MAGKPQNGESPARPEGAPGAFGPWPYYVYMVRCEGDSLYTGITNEPSRRLTEHRKQGASAARYTRMHAVEDLVGLWGCESHARAASLENRIKRLSRHKKDELIAHPEQLADACAQPTSRLRQVWAQSSRALGHAACFAYGEREMDWLCAKDKRLGRVIGELGRIERSVEPDLFCSLVNSIMGQQISSKAHATIWGRAQAGLKAVTPKTVLDAGPERLHSFGMSHRKAEAICELAERMAAGEVNLAAIEHMEDGEAIGALTQLRGIGTWTAEMTLLFCLQRPNVLSFQDLGIIKGMRMVYRHRTIDRTRFERYRKRLSPYGSVASLYFWAVASGAIPSLTDPA